MGALSGRIAIVTGAGSGIGLAIAEAYAAEGAAVVLAARGIGKLDAVAAGIRATGGTALVVPTDVTVEDQVLALFRKTLDSLGRVDIVVNNAGISTRVPTEELPVADFRRVLDVNVTGAFLCSREALKAMKGRGGGRIINIGSVAAKSPRLSSTAYTSSKFALEGLTRAFALDGREHGVTASIIQPGNVQSEFWRGRDEQAAREGIMAASDIARIAVLVATLPPDINMLESVVLPTRMPFLGRG